MRVLPALLLTMMFVAPVGLGSSDPGDDGCLDAIDPTVHRDAAYRVDRSFSLLFPDQQLLVTQDWSRLPTIPVFWAVGDQGVCPLDDLPALLEATDTVLADETRLQAAAWLVAQATDEATLGALELEAVTATLPTEDGAVVTLSATSEQTGMRLEYVVDLARDGAAAATWTAIEVVPGLRQNWEGWFLRVGQTGPFDPSEGLDATVLYPTHDGKQIRITYNPAIYGGNAQVEAEDLERNGVGAVTAYDTIKRDWGFPSADPDNFLDVTLDGCACIFGGNNVNIHLPHLMQSWLATLIPGLWYPDEDGVVMDVVGHEFFHHFQYSMMQWQAPQFVIEGTARFMETAFTPQFSHVPGSLHFLNNINGFNYLALNPHLPPTSHWYSYGLFWGHLYDTNGGIHIIKRVLEESAVSNAFPGFVDRALLTDGVDHRYFGEALADFGVRLATRDMSWPAEGGTEEYDWLAYTPPTPVTNVPVADTGGVPTSSWGASVAPFALRIGVLGHAGASDTAVVTMAGSVDHHGRLVSVTDAEATVSDITVPGAGVSAASDYRALVVARGFPNYAPAGGGVPGSAPEVNVAFV